MVNVVRGLSLKDIATYVYSETLIPELFEIFGEEETVKLLKIFGGTKVNFPPFERILELQRNADVYETLCYSGGVATISMLAKKYNISEVWVRAIFKKMRQQYPLIQNRLEKISNGKQFKFTLKRTPRHSGKSTE